MPEQLAGRQAHRTGEDTVARQALKKDKVIKLQTFLCFTWELHVYSILCSQPNAITFIVRVSTPSLM